MIEALVAGKLVGKPEARTAKSGRTFVQARLRVPAGGEEVIFARLTAFSDTAGAALLALDDGDAVAVAGSVKLGAWVDRDGNAKPNVNMVVSQVLTVYHLKRRREAVQGGGEPGAADPPAPPRTATPPNYGCPQKSTKHSAQANGRTNQHFATLAIEGAVSADARR